MMGPTAAMTTTTTEFDAYPTGRIIVTSRPPWHTPVVVVGIVAAFSLFAVAVALTVFGILQHRDDGRYSRDRDDIQQLRQQLAALDAEVNDLQAELTNKTKAIGFSVYKSGTQAIPSTIITVITSWSTAGGPAAYDVSGGAFDTTAGTFTAMERSKYQCGVAICWDAGPAGTRVMALVNTANGAINSFDVDSYTGTGAVCTVGNVIFDLDVGDLVWVIVLQLTGFAQTVRPTGTTFSIERIAE